MKCMPVISQDIVAEFLMNNGTPRFSDLPTALSSIEPIEIGKSRSLHANLNWL